MKTILRFLAMLPLILFAIMCIVGDLGAQTPYLHAKPAPESQEIQKLRANAQSMVDRVSNLVATYDQTAGRAGRFEVRIVEGRQMFNDQANLPCPKAPKEPELIIGHQWSDLPAMVGRERKLRISKIADGVFAYSAAAEDEVATFFHCQKMKQQPFAVGVHGTVFTDGELNIRQITEEYVLSDSWTGLKIVVDYDEDHRPTNILFTGTYKPLGKQYVTGGTFTGYRQFAATVEIKTD